MVIGPAFGAARRLFRFVPGQETYQMPFPEFVRSPRIVPLASQPSLPPRRANPLPPDPRDILYRPSNVELEVDELLDKILPPTINQYERTRRTHVAPYLLRDPVTGQETASTWNLIGPRRVQTQMLLEASEDDSVNETFGLVLNAMKRAETPEELYPALVQLDALRQRYGRRATLGGSGRIVKGSAGEEGGTAGARTFTSGGAESLGEIPDEIESIIDTEVWRAAYRVGIPESQLGKWSDSFSALDLGSLSQKSEKSELTRLLNSITNVRKRRNDSPEAITRNLEELDKITAPDGPMVTGGFSPREIELISSQIIYARDKIGGPSLRGIELATSSSGKGLPEDKLHAVLVSAIESAKNPDEAFSIAALAKSEIRSLTFLDDLDDRALQRSAVIVRNRMKSGVSSEIANLRTAETPNERFARNFQMRPPPGPVSFTENRIFGAYQNAELFDQIGSIKFTQFGPSNNFRSWEEYDPAFEKMVHIVQKWNTDSKKWEEVARNPFNPNKKFVSTPEYGWIGDAETGMAVRAPRTEFQNFFHRISETSEGSGEIVSLTDRLKLSMENQIASYGLDAGAGKIAKDVLNIIDELVNKKSIIPGTPEYNWMHTVFGRLSLDVYGEGLRKGKALVSRDKNFMRRVAALKALEKAEQSGLVPKEAIDYIRKISPEANAYETAYLAREVTPPPRRAGASRPGTKGRDDETLTVDQELAILRKLLETERAK